ARLTLISTAADVVESRIRMTETIAFVIGFEIAVVVGFTYQAQNIISANGITHDRKCMAVVCGHDNQRICEVYLFQSRPDSIGQLDSVSKRTVSIAKMMGLIDPAGFDH